MAKCYSSTGKAIVAGGYLVLEPQYRALVVALSARMHAVVQKKESADGRLTISVKSPQFKNGLWVYTDGAQTEGSRNPFVESVIEIVCLYVEELTRGKIQGVYEVSMFSDDEYHSQINSVKKVSSTGREFMYHGEEITQVNKTGLGSSAGLVTSLTAALLSVLYEPFDVTDLKWKTKVHNLSQISHCKAQGKIGSGFDVASATFGSIIYQRFDPKLINDLLAVDKSQFAHELVRLVDETDWKMTAEPCKLPPGFTLMMGDVQGGSETPKMVSKVNQWRASEPAKSAEVWRTLNENNVVVMNGLKELERLSQLDPKRYELLLQYVSKHRASDFKSHTVQQQFPEVYSIVEAIETIRSQFRLVTGESGADIEPEPQTLLLDKCWELQGVLGGVVPGAGGYDAICLIVSAEQVPIIRSNSSLENVRWMNLHEESDGLIEESAADFAGLI